MNDCSNQWGQKCTDSKHYGIKQEGSCNENKKCAECECEYSNWSQCSATCGTGQKSRVKNKCGVYIFGDINNGQNKKFVRNCNNLEKSKVEQEKNGT